MLIAVAIALDAVAYLVWGNRAEHIVYAGAFVGQGLLTGLSNVAVGRRWTDNDGEG